MLWFALTDKLGPKYVDQTDCFIGTIDSKMNCGAVVKMNWIGFGRLFFNQNVYLLTQTARCPHCIIQDMFRYTSEVHCCLKILSH